MNALVRQCIKPESRLPEVIRRYASKKSDKCGSTHKKRRAGVLIGASGVHPTAPGAAKSWRNISLFVCIPLLALCAFHVGTTYHEHERPPFIKYEYMYIRHKKFPWRGGADTSLFHNPKINPSSQGYEDELED